MASTIQNRRDTAANWTAVDPVLANGEMGYETDTGKAKIGDGATAWISLAYWVEPGAGLANVVEDLTPQLGGDLDVNGQSIVSIDGGAITAITGATAPTGSSGNMTIGAGNANGIWTIIQGQTETDYDNTPASEGTYNKGSGFTNPGDEGGTITLSDGTVITIDDVGFSARIEAFTVTTAGTGFIGQTNLTQVSTTGSGTGFFLSPQGDNILSTTGNGGTLTLNAGDGFGSGSVGGALTISSGDAGPTGPNAGGGGQGGDLNITSGDGQNYAGRVNITVGTSYNASGRDLKLQAGNSDYQGGDAFGGYVRIQAGAAFATTGTPANSYGGDIFLETAPFGAVPDDGGWVLINAGAGEYDGGDVRITAGSAGTAGPGGDIRLQAGTGISTAGAIVIPTQVAPSPTTDKLYNVAGALTWNAVDLTDTTATDLATTGASVNVDAAIPPTAGQALVATAATTATWQTVAGSGDVVKVGTPVNNQIGVWTGDGTLEGDTGLTWDGTTLIVAGGIDALIEFETQTGTTFSAFTLAHSGQMVTMDNASPNTVTLPANGSVAYPIGTEIHFQQLGAGATTIAITTDTLNVNANLTLVLNGQYAVATALKITATTWTLFGNLVLV